MFPWDTEQNSGEEDENVDGGEAPLGEGESQEEPIEKSREDQNRDILDPLTMETDRGGMSGADKLATDIQGMFLRGGSMKGTRTRKIVNMEQFRTNLPDTPSMTAQDSTDLVGMTSMKMIITEYTLEFFFFTYHIVVLRQYLINFLLLYPPIDNKF